MRFIRDKLVDRLIVMNKGKLTSKLKDIRQHHKTNLSLSTVMITENESGYIFPSSSLQETYLVQESNTTAAISSFVLIVAIHASIISHAPMEYVRGYTFGLSP
ncbi:hypothetical protein NPIL_475911 [Nephila pilipes]|uniref:Uncharacterized protein n=1 Tax=Nephila pilipes TaxID=299642 RepID=A0A8X6Q460_NEPPI|nr:hypothetical protein NPIL_667321 [Nephila pilipes]GFT47823.1 hypothetical protein NPIL_345801 [Nephila pilipes]GFU05492.1 hypothetical protein NPIL_327331 [Nephila pilipes]GFU32651.1 hypothetical protein NPIL_475911 [Nephila pilipes]